MELVRIDEAREMNSCVLAPPRLGEKIFILGEEGTSQFGCAVHQQRIGDASAIIILGRDHINASQA